MKRRQFVSMSALGLTAGRLLAKNSRVPHVHLLIVGAGPFGLAMAAEAQKHDIDHLVLGEPMSFWKEHMPEGMVLRSGVEWHLDPLERYTIEQYGKHVGIDREDIEPMPLDFYLDYAEWFRESTGVQVQRSRAIRLDRVGGGLNVTLADGATIHASNVLLALGFESFAHTPEDLAAIVGPNRHSHSMNCRSPAAFRDQRVLIVGGRQSAFEYAALLAEAGSSAVHVCHRHDTPVFTSSDWTWVAPLLERIGDDPGWYRQLPEAERKALNTRFWEEGRIKLEPWLADRTRHPAIHVRPYTQIVAAEERNGFLAVTLDAGDTLQVDHVMFATGYRVDVSRVPLLNSGNFLDAIDRSDGFPELDESLQTSVPGLFMTSLTAARDFGLFFAFTASVRASARIVARAVS